MKNMLLKLLITVSCVAMVACSSDDANQGLNSASPGNPKTLDGGNPKAGPVLQGSDQGREGGHFLICTEEASVPVDGEFVTPYAIEDGDADDNSESIYFIDYALTIKTQEDFDALLPFEDGESDTDRLHKVSERLIEIYKDDEVMKNVRISIIAYRSFFLDEFGTSEFWTEDIRSPHMIPLTEDVTKSHLPEDIYNMVENNCGSSLYQAVTYKYDIKVNDAGSGYTTNDQFHFSKHFQQHSSRMQKSFRNVHELFRYIIKNESEQVQQLTAYAHTGEFFEADKETVRKRIAEISDATANAISFLGTPTTAP